MNKYYVPLLLAVALLLVTTGCAPIYGSKKQYIDGEWYWFATRGQVAEIIQDEQNIEATNALEPKIGYAQKDGKKIFLGFEGIVINDSDSVESVTISTFRGQRITGWLIPPHTRLPGYLPPGQYVRHLDGTKIYQKFPVDTHQYNVEGVFYHWFIHLR
jgi:hypothetical protein